MTIPTISTDNNASSIYIQRNKSHFALGEGPGRVFRRPVHIIYELRVVQRVDHRRRRGAAKCPGAAAGSDGSARLVDLSGITTTVRPPHSPQSVRTTAYHWPLCSIGNWAHGGGTAAAKRLTIPTISIDETNASSSYEGIGPHFALGEGPGRVWSIQNTSCPLPIG